MSTRRLAVIDANRCVGCQCCMFACNRRLGVGGLSRSAIHISSVGGISRGFSVNVCRACEDPPCADVCPTQAMKRRDGGGVKFHPDLCTKCGSCMNVCILGAITWDTENNVPIVCIYCGICARYCPYQVIGLEDISGDM